MNSTLWKNSIGNIIDQIIVAEKCQKKLDIVYSRLLKVIFTDLDQNLKYRDSSNHTKKRFRNNKPYWCNEFTFLWKKMRECEKLYSKQKKNDTQNKVLWSNFKNARSIFDKKLKQAERNYRYTLLMKLEEVNTSDPQTFWNHLKKVRTTFNF